IEDWVVGSLRKLNRIRNRLAHELDATVTRDEVLALFMGIDHLMPIDPKTADISLLVYHYTPFIFGNLLPKLEPIPGRKKRARKTALRRSKGRAREAVPRRPRK